MGGLCSDTAIGGGGDLSFLILYVATLLFLLGYGMYVGILNNLALHPAKIISSVMFLSRQQDLVERTFSRTGCAN